MLSEPMSGIDNPMKSEAEATKVGSEDGLAEYPRQKGTVPGHHRVGLMDVDDVGLCDLP
jgi:hypothetical protein